MFFRYEINLKPVTITSSQVTSLKLVTWKKGADSTIEQLFDQTKNYVRINGEIRPHLYDKTREIQKTIASENQIRASIFICGQMRVTIMLTNLLNPHETVFSYVGGN